MKSPPLTRSVGSAERSMRALLERKLQGANLSFLEWTTLVFSSASHLSSEQVVQQQIGSRVAADAAEAHSAISALVAAGFMAIDSDNMLVKTGKGAGLFATLSHEIEEIALTLYGDLPIADLEATHRTLMEITKRASHRLDR
jgi:hypothetical protein